MPGESLKDTPGRVLARGNFLELAVLPGSGFECVHRVNCTGVVSIAARTVNGKLLFVEQFRPPVNGRTIELVAGLAGDLDREELLEAAARRELLEETGYAAGTIRHLFNGPSAGGMSSSIVSFYFADACTRQHEGGGVDGEDITVHAVPQDVAFAWLQRQSAAGLHVDPKAYVSLAFAANSR